MEEDGLEGSEAREFLVNFPAEERRYQVNPAPLINTTSMDRIRTHGISEATGTVFMIGVSQTNLTVSLTITIKAIARSRPKAPETTNPLALGTINAAFNNTRLPKAQVSARKKARDPKVFPARRWYRTSSGSFINNQGPTTI